MSSVQAKIVKFVRQEKVKIEREKIEKIDLQDIEILNLVQKDFKMIINILKEQKMVIIGKNIKEIARENWNLF